MNRNEIEYISVTVVTILHGIFTGVMLGGMPLVSLTELTQTNIAGICVWLFYGAILYVLVHLFKCQNKRKIIICVQAVGFGILTALAKGCIDYCMARFMERVQLRMMQVACFDEIVTVVFGAAIMSCLMFLISGRKLHYRKSAWLPLGMIIMLVVMYICMVTSYFFQNRKAIAAFDANFEEIQNLDYHFAFKILDLNVWFYVIIYILFWWFLRTVTEEQKKTLDVSTPLC